MFVLAVIERPGETNIPVRWRRYRTLKLAIAHGRRNLKAGKWCWIERKTDGDGKSYATVNNR